MAITACPVTPTFAAEIGDVDLSRQIDPTDLAAIKNAFTKYAILIFPDQYLSQDQHLDFAWHFGPLETSIAVYRKDAPLRVRQEFAVTSALIGFVGASTDYVGDRLGNFIQGTLEVRDDYPSYFRTDVTFGIKKDRLEVTGFIDNLANKRGLLSGGLSYTPPNAYTFIRPRSYGINVSQSF